MCVLASQGSITHPAKECLLQEREGYHLSKHFVSVLQLAEFAPSTHSSFIIRCHQRH